MNRTTAATANIGTYNEELKQRRVEKLTSSYQPL